jgi:hypothetical protein
VHTYRKCGRVDNQVVRTHEICIIIIIIIIIIIVMELGPGAAPFGRGRRRCGTLAGLADPSPHFFPLAHFFALAMVAKMPMAIVVYVLTSLMIAAISCKLGLNSNVSGHCGPLYVSGHCGPLYESGHCGPLYVSGHCGPLYVSGHCGKR